MQIAFTKHLENRGRQSEAQKYVNQTEVLAKQTVQSIRKDLIKKILISNLSKMPMLSLPGSLIM